MGFSSLRTGLLSWIEKSLPYAFLLCLCKLISHVSVMKRVGASKTGKSFRQLLQSSVRLTGWLLSWAQPFSVRKRSWGPPPPSFPLPCLLPLLLQNILESVPHQDLLQAASIFVVWCSWCGLNEEVGDKGLLAFPYLFSGLYHRLVSFCIFLEKEMR